MGTVFEALQAAPVWQVAKHDGQPYELESYLFHTLEPDALVWSEGLTDWLPLGDIPPLEEMPPVPRGATDHATSESSPPKVDGSDSSFVK